MDEYGMTWFKATLKIKLLPDTQKRQPYPLSWDEQTPLFKELPDHLVMKKLLVNTRASLIS